ncbi:MAG: nucleotidyltransferase domain-containing protein [Rhodospirillaceae bacterium]|nr:nucleotidyltransferase domain-containing protein [Rhodospirillaceae bacterium]
MPLPVMSLRAERKHQSVLRGLARALRDRPELARDVGRLLKDLPARPVHAAIGPFKDESAALDFIRNRLVAALKPEEIWLIGSRARGDHRRDSDFDILVVQPDREPLLDPRRAHEPIAASGLACDVVACRRSAFDAERTQAGTLPFAASTQGRQLYVARRPGANRAA